MQHIRIATRQSKLALWQAEHVAQQLRQHHPHLSVELIPITTQGDKILNQPLAKIGGKGLFIKELEIAMLEDKADIAVHSMKDVGVDLPQEFTLAAILERDTPLDALVSNQYDSLETLPLNARIGTCSLRRRMNLAAQRPDLQLIDLRGNLQTRLAKLDHQEYDAIVLACAGLKRLNLAQRIRQILPAKTSLPAIGQGAIGIECRHDNLALLNLLQTLNHAPTALCVRTERIINTRLQGSCQVPIAAYATLEGERIHLQTRLGTPDGKTILQAQGQDHQHNAEALGHRLADQLIEQGAPELLQKILAQNL